ncbi:MAG TPA: TlpA disulfide reductase family protein [Candidatus Binataceae bacterium]|nr:TlpA disulfide reductase family protein [Candidatus Binataceae bacterium]
MARILGCRIDSARPAIASLVFVMMAATLGPFIGAQSMRMAQAAEPLDATDFTARALAGGKIRLSDYRGHPVIVDFWATWCGPCRRQLPELNALYKKYGKSRGLVVIGVACDTVQGDSEGAIAPFVHELKIEYPIAIADDSLTDRLGIDAIPTTLFIDADGREAKRLIGASRQGGDLTESARQWLEPIPNGKLMAL